MVWCRIGSGINLATLTDESGEGHLIRKGGGCRVRGDEKILGKEGKGC